MNKLLLKEKMNKILLVIFLLLPKLLFGQNILTNIDCIEDIKVLDKEDIEFIESITNEKYEYRTKPKFKIIFSINKINETIEFNSVSKNLSLPNSHPYFENKEFIYLSIMNDNGLLVSVVFNKQVGKLFYQFNNFKSFPLTYSAELICSNDYFGDYVQIK